MAEGSELLLRALPVSNVGIVGYAIAGPQLTGGDQGSRNPRFLVPVNNQGMLEMTGHPDGTVEHRKCIKNGDAECEFHIKW